MKTGPYHWTQLVVLPFILLTLLLSACSPQTEYNITDIVIDGGNHQAALCGDTFSDSLMVRVLGPRRPGLLGGKGSAEPTLDAVVQVAVKEGSSLRVIGADSVVTKHDGTAKFQIAAGDLLGDQYLVVTAKNNRGEIATATARFISGLQLNWEVQEGYAEEMLDDPMELRIMDKDRKPIPGVQVYFKPIDKVTLDIRNAVTDSDGRAVCGVRLGKKTGPYLMGFEIHDPAHDLQVTTKTVKGMGINSFGLIIAVACGLALFIFGMKTMGDGLHLIAGDRMKKVLGFLTRNRLMGVAAGALVTAIIQSSSATTVMVVGFVNAGLLSLAQSISVIFGANIGTTMTAQIIAFKLDFLAQPAIILGLLGVLLAKKSYYQGWANTILGFGLLFFGMGIMSSELKIAGEFPTFIDFFRTFECAPVNGVMPLSNVLGAIAIGTIMTIMIQSSSATIGIAIALASSGLLSFWTAFPLILGDNIGTTITAVLASIGGNRRAKQTALAHVMFNVLGVVWVTSLLFVTWPGTDYPIALYFVNRFTPGNGFEGENVVRHIANAHTLFNVMNVCVLLPFVGYIAWIVTKLIPIRSIDQEKFNYLDPHLLDTPPVALDQVMRSIRYMVKESSSMIGLAIEKNFLVGKVDRDLAARLSEREAKVDRVQKEVTRYLVHLSQRRLTDSQHKIIPLLVHCTNNAERIADQAEVVMTLAGRLEEANVTISDETIEELSEILALLRKHFTVVLALLDRADKADFKELIKAEGQIDLASAKFESLHLNRLTNRDENATAGVVVIELIGEIERISTRLVNIGERVGKAHKLASNLQPERGLTETNIGV